MLPMRLTSQAESYQNPGGAKVTSESSLKVYAMKTLTAAVAALCLTASAATVARQAATPPASDRLTTEVLKGLAFRSIGPVIQTGRVQDIAIDPKNPNVWYVAAAFGGLWKTINRGTTFTPIFDDGGSFNLCCVVIDPKNSDVVWLGTGENKSQRSAHFGDGIYKSTDAGKTWRRMGLEKSEHIGQILIDPRNSNVVYAGSYQRRRHVGQMIGGGPEGGIWKTADGGKKWTKLSKGLPKDDVGRIALGVDPKNPTRVYAMISAKFPSGRGGGGGGRGGGEAGAAQ